MATSPGFGILNYAILIAYMMAIVGIGCLFAGKQKTTEDYFLASRKMPWLVVGMSMFASLTSAISYMGIPGTAYKENVSLLMMALISPIVAPFLGIQRDSSGKSWPGVAISLHRFFTHSFVSFVCLVVLSFQTPGVVESLCRTT